MGGTNEVQLLLSRWKASEPLSAPLMTRAVGPWFIARNVWTAVRPVAMTPKFAPVESTVTRSRTLADSDALVIPPGLARTVSVPASWTAVRGWSRTEILHDWLGPSACGQSDVS